jgi:hypothetical protein
MSYYFKLTLLMLMLMRNECDDSIPNGVDSESDVRVGIEHLLTGVIIAYVTYQGSQIMIQYVLKINKKK